MEIREREGGRERERERERERDSAYVIHDCVPLTKCIPEHEDKDKDDWTTDWRRWWTSVDRGSEK